MDEPGHVRARCDFCGRAELMVRWNQRTCVKCDAEGAPDQSLAGYEEKCAAWYKARIALKVSRIEYGGTSQAASTRVVGRGPKASTRRVKRLGAERSRIAQDAITKGA